ncbi:MAG: transglycosylase SLT domain-containing protein [Alphaproteobacteria bacterium]|nr:transglycosylase SLT domain-containing protein [Alphaproteobacteria bacterium]
MSALLSQIIDKYQSVAPQRVIQAIEKASARTGANFSFMMDKASAESSFNPSATSKSSTATGLFQFIESTWLNMVKQYGAKHGMGKFANQIQIRNGRPCVDNCNVKDTILNLRKNPEIAALMAGEFSAQNKQYLEKHTNENVGATELYLAHFMGASGATRFLNARNSGGETIAANLFPKEALTNKNVFFNPATGHARTLNGIYDFFAQKFGSENVATDSLLKKNPIPPSPTYFDRKNPPVSESRDNIQQHDMYLHHAVNLMTQKSPSSYPPMHSLPMSKLSAESILLMAQMQMLLLPPIMGKHRDNANLY